MKTKQVKLIQALRSPETYGDVSKMAVHYIPDYDDEILDKKSTGIWNVPFQYIKTQILLDWHPFLYNGRAYLIPDRTTYCSTVILATDIGTKGENEILKRHAMLYESAQLGTKGVTLTAKMLKAMPMYLWKTDRRCFVSEPFGSHSKGLWCAGISGNVRLLTGEKKNPRYIEADLRPVVLLPRDILVTFGVPGKDGSNWEKALPIMRSSEF